MDSIAARFNGRQIRRCEQFDELVDDPKVYPPVSLLGKARHPTGVPAIVAGKGANYAGGLLQVYLVYMSA
jgi:hypothetical protein